MDRSWKNFDVYSRKSLNCLKVIVSGNINVKSNSGEGGRRDRHLNPEETRKDSPLEPLERHFSTDTLILDLASRT